MNRSMKLLREDGGGSVCLFKEINSSLVSFQINNLLFNWIQRCKTITTPCVAQQREKYKWHRQ